ncbi:hypothetical protein AWENTII_006840 [Aspergillus wentii]
MSHDEVFVPGVCGPYRDVLLPDAFMAEGGQSATGEMIRHVLESHPSYQTAKEAADQADARREQASSIPYIARYFFYGDLWGNRSPIADARMTGAAIGLRSDKSIDSLALHYYGALEFIALQTRQIVETMNEHGHQITCISMSGSQTQNDDLLVGLIASACNIPIVVPEYEHAAVCHGAAMLGVKAASGSDGGEPKDLWSIMGEMSRPGRCVQPSTDMDEQRLLQVKYEVFLDMCIKQREYRSLVDGRLKGRA